MQTRNMSSSLVYFHFLKKYLLLFSIYTNQKSSPKNDRIEPKLFGDHSQKIIQSIVSFRTFRFNMNKFDVIFLQLNTNLFTTHKILLFYPNTTKACFLEPISLLVMSFSQDAGFSNQFFRNSFQSSPKSPLTSKEGRT